MSRSDHATKHSSYRQWPGERHPTQWDVHDANQSPAVSFLERFRVALLHSEDAEEEEGDDLLLEAALIIGESETLNSTITPPVSTKVAPTRFTIANALDQTESSSTYTYPMALLSDSLTMPSEDELVRLQGGFYASFKQHIFINSVDVTDTSGIIPPYLQLALACISSVTSPVAAMNEHQSGSGFFVTGVHLWSVMLEVDNREARLLEAVVAVSGSILKRKIKVL